MPTSSAWCTASPDEDHDPIGGEGDKRASAKVAEFQAGGLVLCLPRHHGDELPPELATREGRKRWLRGARRAATPSSTGGIDRFQRCGRSAVRSEWRLITATHNLLKLHTHQLAIAAA